MASSLSDIQNATADSFTAGETTSTSEPSRSSSGRAPRTRSASTGSVARTRSLTRRKLPRPPPRKRRKPRGRVSHHAGDDLAGRQHPVDQPGGLPAERHELVRAPGADPRDGRGKEPGADVDALGAEHECGGESG